MTIATKDLIIRDQLSLIDNASWSAFRAWQILKLPDGMRNDLRSEHTRQAERLVIEACDLLELAGDILADGLDY